MPDVTALWFLPAIGLAMTIALFLNGSARSPANLVPIQILGAASIVTLVLAQETIILTSFVIAIKFAGAVRWLLLFPAMLAITTLLRAVAHVISSRRPAMSRNAHLPPELDRGVDEIRNALGPAENLGFDSIDVEMTASEETAVETIVRRSRRLTILVGRPLVNLLERPRRAGDDEAIAALVRFIVLHEVSHFINGDVHTYRLNRAIHLAYSVWLRAWPLPFATVAALTAAGSVQFDAAVRISVWCGVSMVIALVPLTAQRRLAARFCLEREELADWRARELLSPRQLELLFRTKGNGSRVAPWLLSKMNALEVRRKRGNARSLNWLWPPPPPFRARVDAVIARSAGSRHDPFAWARQLGVQTGMITALFVLSTVVSAASAGADMDVTLRSMLWTLSLVWVPLGTYAVIRTDPRRLRYFEESRTARVAGAAALFVVPAMIAAITGFLAVALPLGLARIWRADGAGGLLTVVVFVESFAVVLLAWVFLPHTINDGDGGTLRESAAEDQLRVIPVVVALAIALLLSIVGTRVTIGLADAVWVPVWVVTVIVFALCTAASNSRNRVVRALVPVGVLPSSGLMCSVRFGWRNLHVDGTRNFAAAVLTASVLLSAAMGAVAAMLVAVAAIVATAAGPSAVWKTMGFFLLVSVLLILIVRSERERYRWSDPTVRLLTSSYLATLAGLLRIFRNDCAHAPLAHEVRRWIADERLPDPLLPTREEPWYLITLRHLLEVAWQSDSAAPELWRGRLLASVRDILRNRDDVSVRAGSRKPSLLYTANAAMVLRYATLCNEVDCERMLVQVSLLAARRIRTGGKDSVTGLAAAAQAFDLYGRAMPEIPPTSVVLPRRIHDKQSLVALVLLIRNTDRAGLTELASIATSRACRLLLRNPRKEVLMLLDCYEVALRLGIQNETVFEAAKVILTESAEDVARDLRTLMSHREKP